MDVETALGKSSKRGEGAFLACASSMRATERPQPRTQCRRRRGAGDFLAYCDADDVVSPGWLSALASASCHADIVGGSLEFERLNDPVSFAWRPSDPLTELPVKHDFLSIVPGGNCGIWSDVARDLGWDGQFLFGSSDIEFSWHAHLASYRLAYEPGALVSVRFRSRIRHVAHQWFRYGTSGARLYRQFRHLGMPPSDGRAAAEEWRWIVTHPHHLVGSVVHRGQWVRRAAFRTGRLVGSVSCGVAFP